MDLFCWVAVILFSIPDYIKKAASFMKRLYSIDIYLFLFKITGPRQNFRRISEFAILFTVCEINDQANGHPQEGSL